MLATGFTNTFLSNEFLFHKHIKNECFSELLFLRRYRRFSKSILLVSSPIFFILNGGQDSILGIMTCYRLNDLGSNPAVSKILRADPDWPKAHPTFQGLSDKDVALTTYPILAPRF